MFTGYPQAKEQFYTQTKKISKNTIVINNLEDIKIDEVVLAKITQKLKQPNAERIFYLGDAFRAKLDIEKFTS